VRVPAGISREAATGNSLVRQLPMGDSLSDAATDSAQPRPSSEGSRIPRSLTLGRSTQVWRLRFQSRCLPRLPSARRRPIDVQPPIA
jgi:hypothetical protein